MFVNSEITPYLPESTISTVGRYLPQGIQENGKEIIILDAPTLIQSGTTAMCDEIIVVTAPEELRRARIMERDKLTEAEADARMSAQKEEAFYTQHADHIIDGTQDLCCLAENKETEDRYNENL